MRTASEIGISYSELMEMDIRTFNAYVDGYVARRERRMNDDLLVNHLTLGKMMQGINADKKFSKPIEPIKLTEEKSSAASRNAKIYRYLQAKGLL